MAHLVLRVLTLSNINRFSSFVYWQNQEKICNIIIKKSKAPQRGVLSLKPRPLF